MFKTSRSSLLEEAPALPERAHHLLRTSRTELLISSSNPTSRNIYKGNDIAQGSSQKQIILSQIATSGESAWLRSK
jgi:hypothetical protein